MVWKEVRDFINKQLDDNDELDFIEVVCKIDDMDLTIGFAGAVVDENQVIRVPQGVN